MTPPIAPVAPAAAPHRRWRASILAVVVVYVAVLGHLTGGGMVPDLPSIAVAFGLSWPVCWQLSTIRRGFPVILAVLALAQPVLHLVLEFGGALLAGATGSAGHAGHQAAATLTDGSVEVAAPAGSGTVAMLSFHAVAALVSAVVLARGERVLTGVLSAGRRVAGWVVSLLAARAGAPAPGVELPARPDTRALPPRLTVSLPARHGRRGPPRALGAH